ncbi:MAG TPA: chromosomal replication initiator protein DnaA [Candidatus Faecimorpha stercoravium]|nr:chromosomal replication initiator protein DnaA [Candidatus Faecimorpha stercoravium]
MKYDPSSIYSEIQQLLRQDLTEVTYKGWFQDMQAVDVVEDGSKKTLILESENPLAKKIVSTKFRDHLQKCFEMLNYNDFTFEIVDKGKYQLPLTSQEEENSILESLKIQAHLNPRYTFESFVEGNHNKLAYHSCLAVADFPGNTYNPLFIWGDSGLGKTHLLHAIGNHVLDCDSSKHVLYVPSETFMNELINSISSNKNDSFREKYRQIDVLLIDDIQFLGNKQATQDEFFHTFNTLYNDNKQIVICSDRPPEEIEQLSERIRSRFKWGLIADIQAPDYETRIAILKKKSEQNHLDIDMDVLSFIADHINSNIRDLEGALTCVEAYCRLLSPNTKVTIEIASNALKDYTGNDIKKTISCQRIIETVCEYYQITVDDIKSKKKPQNIAYPRQICMYLCRKLTTDPLKTIGTALGGRDRTTVMYGADKIADDLKNLNNEELLRAVNDIERRLTGE